MALIHSFEKSGNWLFRYRGQLPLILFLLAVPVIYFTPVAWVEENPKLEFLLGFAGVMVSFLGFCIRAYTIGTTPRGTSGRNTQEQVAETLNSTGIYSMLRHPLYLGNYLMWMGIVIYCFNVWFFVLVSLLFWLYYERIMFAEERFLERKFGQQYLDWSLKAPAFWPAFSKYKPTHIPFSLKSVLRREYSGVLAVAISFLFVDLLRLFFAGQHIDWNRPTVWAVGVSLLLSVILRTLKRKTTLLKEEGRS